jgi:hypothetical protein
MSQSNYRCSIDDTHDPPFEMYLWNERKTWVDNATGAIHGRQHVARHGLLCRACARFVGAWQLPKKEVTHESK